MLKCSTANLVRIGLVAATFISTVYMQGQIFEDNSSQISMISSTDDNAQLLNQSSDNLSGQTAEEANSD